MGEIIESSKNYLQKISSLPTGLRKPLKLQKPYQSQTTTSTPTGRKTNYYSSQSHFFSSQKLISSQKPITHLPSPISAQPKHYPDHSLTSINSKIQNEEEKQNLMKKQSIYLYIKKYLQAQEGTPTKMKFQNRYAMYRPESTTDKKHLHSSKQYFLPKVNPKEALTTNFDPKITQNSSNHDNQLNLTKIKGKKQTHLQPPNENLQTSRQSNISSRRRVNQMLKRDKQLNNLHRNGHHAHSHSSSQQKFKQKQLSKSKNKSKQLNEIISEKFQTLEEAIQVDLQQEEEIKRKIQEERIENQRLERQALEKLKMEKMKQQIKDEIFEKIAEKQEQEASRQEALMKQLSLTEQLSMLQNRQNQFSFFVQKVQQQHSFKNLAQLKEIVDNTKVFETKKELIDKEVSCKLLDAQELTVKEKQRLQKQIQLQKLRDQLEKVEEKKKELEEQKKWQLKRAEGQEGVEKELREMLGQMKKKLQVEAEERQSVIKEREELEKRQRENEEKNKLLEENLIKEQNKYSVHSLTSALDLINQMNTKAGLIETSLVKNQKQNDKIRNKSNQISEVKKREHVKQIKSLQVQLAQRYTAVQEKIKVINEHLKSEHEKYLKLMEVRKSEAEQRKQSLELSHLSLRQKVADMELLKQELKQLKIQLEAIALQQKQAHEQYEQQAQQLKKLKASKERVSVKREQRKYNKEAAKSETVKNNESLLKLANQCEWGLFPIQQTKEQETVTFVQHLKGSQNGQKQLERKEEHLGVDQKLQRPKKVGNYGPVQREDQVVEMVKASQRMEMYEREQEEKYQQGNKVQDWEDESQRQGERSEGQEISDEDYDEASEQCQEQSFSSDREPQIHFFENNHAQLDANLSQDHYDGAQSQSQFECYIE